MNKPIVLFCSVILLSLVISSCDSHKDLFKQTDYFVDQLTTTYSSYGLQGLSDKRFTEDHKYGVAPMGRLVIVRIEEYAPSSEYEKLCKTLKKHYKGDHRVNQVYINQAGTVVIDCRN